MELTKYPESYWRSSTTKSNYPKLSQDIETDICVVGGGITGITTAYKLANKQIKTVLIDAGEVLQGVTSCTTAKITAQHGMIYDELIKSHGIEKAQIFYRAQDSGLSFIKETIDKLGIDCDFKNSDAYLFTQEDKESKELEREYKAYQSLNIPCEFSDKSELPFAVKTALLMKDQAQFHPLQFLKSISDAYVEQGGEIFQNTVAVDIESEKDKEIVITNDGVKITCRRVVIATHFPFIDRMGFYFARMHAEKSYVLGLKSNWNYPGGMYINAEKPARSIRQSTFNGENLLLIGGEGHITGQGEPTLNHYKNLMDYAREYFDISEIKYRWSTQDLVSTDKLPFVGPISATSSGILVATGFRKWGMTNSIAAANLLTDIITDQENEYSELVSPTRFGSITGLASNFYSMSKELIGGKVKKISKEPEELSLDEGGAVNVNAKKCGAYRDQNGDLHIVDTTCTHMGCELAWNGAERTWDCPCHGSRFNYDGDVIEGPAKKPLGKIDN